MAWSTFTPLSALLGGALIGLAASLLWLTNGRVAGISGIVSGLVPGRAFDVSWRLSFLGGLLAVGVVASLLAPATVAVSSLRGPAVMLVAGVVVGFGTRLGNGCTSGHGICGLARFSKRSFAATLTFMAFGFLTVFLLRHAGLT